jgi:hypothetical protein
MPADDPFAPAADVSPVAEEFARRIAPRLISQLADRKDAIIASGKNALVRLAIKGAWPVGISFVPNGTKTGAQAMLDEFGGMTLAEVASKLLAHNAARGVASHPSLYHH